MFSAECVVWRHFLVLCSSVTDTYSVVCFSRSGEVLGSRKDYKMNNVSIDMTTGCVVLDAQSQPLINSMAPLPQQPSDIIS